ncbi:MAG: hypothetical protein HY520_04715 [Candidatus Aenigmarchaeota archaeon]|nr:hypothetical protein [Candidatus Aenigmarchaeota archaeon]
MFADALGFLLLLGATVVVGYVGGALYTRTRVPDAVWLLLFGLIVVPGLGRSRNSPARRDQDVAG